MYKYETHLHTAPVSRCASASVEETVEFYKKLGYDGIFITNHFFEGDVNFDNIADYKEDLKFFFSDYEKGVELGRRLGIKVFLGAEMSYGGSDALVYGLDKEWYFSHPEILQMNFRDRLEFLMESGALVIQAHPFREARYIDHIRLFPRSVHGVEVINACRTDFENEMASLYAQKYGLLTFAGSDNHCGEKAKRLAGLRFAEPVLDERDFVERVKNGKAEIFFG